MQPPVATEATPSSVVAKEATPPPVVAEAPPLPPVAQQQPTPPSFCPLCFEPFSSLLTSYRVPASLSSPVCVPDLRRQSPPQPHQPTRKLSPADTAEPAHSTTPIETVLAQALSPAADPEISEERAAHRAEEPEEPERDKEPQEDELSDYASQSSPSSSFPETSPQRRLSVLAFIAPLAESLRAELSAIQVTVARTGSTTHMYSAALATLEDEVDALVALASDLDHCAGDSSEQEHAEGFGTLMDRLGALMGSARTVEESTADGAASNTDRSTGDPEEPEQEEELQDNEQSDCPSQSSPSSSSLELDPPHCRPSALNFIAPLAELLRAELSTVQDTVAQTGSAEHKYSDTLATLEDEVDALVALARELDRCAEAISEQEHAAGFGALIDRLGALMSSAHVVEDSAEGNAEPDDTPADNPKGRPSAGTAEEDEEHDRSCSSSSIGEEGELSALSWEEIPSSMYIPPHHYSLLHPGPRTIPSDFAVSFLLSPVDPPPPSIPSDIYSAPTCLYSPHTHADTNPKPRTAFFSVGRRLGVAHDPAHRQRKPSPPRPRSAASAPQSPRRHNQQPATSPGMCIVRRQKKIKAFPVARQQVFKLPVRFQHRRQP